VRHLRSILYAIVLAPAVWVLCGVGFSHDRTGRVESATGLLLLLLAGAAYAILVFAPISPAGPLLAGVVFLGVGVWSLAAPSTYADLWAPGVSKAGFDLSVPGYGLAVLLAVPLICTALSSRRWERYEPPQLPLIGTIGKPFGMARPAGLSMAVMETAVMQTNESPDETVVMRPSPASPVSPVSPVSSPASPSSPPSPPSPPSDEPTVVAVLEDERVTEAVDQPGAAEEVTTAYAVSSAGEITTTAVPVASEVPPAEVAAEASTTAEASTRAEAAAAADAGETTEPMLLADQPTEAVVSASSAEGTMDDLGSDALPEPVSENTTDVVVQAVPGEADTEAVPHPAEEETTDVISAEADTQAVVPPATDDDDEKTQVIKLPLGELTTDDLRRIPGERPTHNIDDGGRTQVIGPAERTQVIARDTGEETQVIRLPSPRTPHSDGERTQVIRLGTGTVEPPGDRTQVLRLPTGETTTERREPPSIVNAERPNPGDDPTTLLVPPGRTNPGEETTVDVGDTKKRIMTVMNLERPADEAADDTRRLVAPPPPPRQRRADDETP
jgi:hypothetical protein